MIPDAAIEAAAEAIPNWMGAGRDDLPVLARAAIEAAMPAIEEAFRQAMSDKIEGDAGFNEHPWKVGMVRAQLIVRGGTP